MTCANLQNARKRTMAIKIKKRRGGGGDGSTYKSVLMERSVITPSTGKGMRMTDSTKIGPQIFLRLFKQAILVPRKWRSIKARLLDTTCC